MVVGVKIADVREEGETDDEDEIEEPASTVEKVKKVVGSESKKNK